MKDRMKKNAQIGVFLAANCASVVLHISYERAEMLLLWAVSIFI